MYFIAFRSLVANLAAANNFKKNHLDVESNKKIIDEAKYIYVGVSKFISFSYFELIITC